MSGRWLVDEEPEHRCRTPQLWGAYSALGYRPPMLGDRWECDCGRVWQLVPMPGSSDERDVTWEMET